MEVAGRGEEFGQGRVGVRLGTGEGWRCFGQGRKRGYGRAGSVKDRRRVVVLGTEKEIRVSRVGSIRDRRRVAVVGRGKEIGVGWVRLRTAEWWWWLGEGRRYG